MRGSFERSRRMSSMPLRSISARSRTMPSADLGWIARHAAAAFACDDPQIVGDLLRWLVALLGPRGVLIAAFLEPAVPG